MGNGKLGGTSKQSCKLVKLVSISFSIFPVSADGCSEKQVMMSTHLTIFSLYQNFNIGPTIALAQFLQVSGCKTHNAKSPPKNLYNTFL